MELPTQEISRRGATDCFHNMPVGIKHVCGIVVFVITQPQPGLTVVYATSIKRGLVKSIDRRASRCRERNMEAASTGAAAADIELRRLPEAEARALSAVGAVDLNHGLYAERREGSHIERPTQCDVLYRKINVIKHCCDHSGHQLELQQYGRWRQ